MRFSLKIVIGTEQTGSLNLGLHLMKVLISLNTYLGPYEYYQLYHLYPVYFMRLLFLHCQNM